MLLTPRELLQMTVALYRKEFWLFLGYAAWLLVPAAAFSFAIALPPNPVTTTLIIVTVVLQLFVWLWIIVCLMRATILLSEQKPIDHDLLSTQALQRIQPVLAVVFLQALLVFGGLLLLIIPSILFWTWYSLAHVAAGVDDRRPIEALAQSRSLVTGRFFSVLWRLVSGPVVITLGYGFLLATMLYGIALLFQLDTTQLLSDHPPLWENLVDIVVYVFMIPLYVIYLTLLYRNLKTTVLEKTSSVA
ncbi:hypothetical protein HY630_03660 [Candidatus Uhrbacteria bacterium]|nr:hypothetical protein [Candidatus Uhrbacteria bacterium]